MKLPRRTFMCAGALAVAASLCILVAPKAAHALSTVATLVRDVDNAARDPFQAVFTPNCAGTLGSFDCSGGLSVPTVNGAGQTISMLVIENVGITCLSLPTGVTGVFFTNYSNAQINTILNLTTGISPAMSTSGYFFQILTGQDRVFYQSTRLYAAPGSQLTVVGGNGLCSASVSGYFVTP